MAITVATGNNFLTATAYGNVSKQYANNISSGGSLLVAFVSVLAATAKTLSCSDDINGSWTSLPYVLNSGLVTQLQIFYKYNSAAGSKPTVSITGLVAEQSSLAIVEFTGVMSTADPIDVYNSNSVNGGSGYPTSGTMTTTTNGLVVGYAEMYPAATPSAGAGFTLGTLINHTSGYPGGVQYKLNATTGSNAAVWGNASQSYWGSVGAAFKAALPISSSGVFTRKVVRNSQPQINTPIDYSNPINVGLQSFISFNRREIDSIGRTQLSRVGTGLTPNQTTMGKGISSNGGTNYFTAATGTKLVCADTKFSVLLTIKLNATGQTNTYAVFERASYGTGTQSAIIYGYTSNQFEFYSPGFSGSDPRTGSGITVADLLPHTILYTYDGTLWSGYLDGVCVFSVARSFTVPLNDSTGTAAILNAAGSHQLNATIINYATWSVGLQPSAAVEVSMNPWQLFTPIRKYLPTAPAGNTTTTQTITGQSRITATTTKTETGKARIQVTTTKTESGTARIGLVTTKTETGLSRIQKVVNQTISGVANIATSTITTTKTITGTGRVQKTVTQTESGVSRIQKSVSQTESGISRIQKVFNQTITGVANITSSIVTTTKTISGVSRITATTTRTETGTGRIQKAVTQTETGQARISITTTKIETGKSRIQTVVNQTETGKSRITATSSQTITGKAKIVSSSAGVTTVPLSIQSVEVGAGISQSITPSGNMLEVEIVASAPVDPPVNGKGVVFMISGGVVTIYVWSGSAWIAK